MNGKTAIILSFDPGETTEKGCSRLRLT